MPVGEIIAIGTELLLGEIQDTNTSYIARKFRDHGIDIFRTTIVGDNFERISSMIQEALQRSDILITTGGLGPTVDDPTRLAVATAFGVGLEYVPLLWEQILDRFKRFGREPSENNRRQAYIPLSATYIENPVGTAPCFYLEKGEKIVISLPGVPREMEYLLANSVFPLLHQKYKLDSVIKALVIHTAGIGESTVDELVGDLELGSNPTVGLLAHPGQTDIRITAKATCSEEADKLIRAVADDVFQRLGIAAFGVDSQTLTSVTTNLIDTQSRQVYILECGFDGALGKQLLHINPSKLQILNSAAQLTDNIFRTTLRNLNVQKSTLVFGFCYKPNGQSQELTCYQGDPENFTARVMKYGGPAGLGPQWALNTSVDIIRRTLLEDHD